MKSLLKKLLSKFGIRNAYDARRHRHYSQLKERLEKTSTQQPDNKKAQVVIFSKDRAMQLDALLRSYFHFAENTIPVQVLYYASKEEFSQGYQELIKIYGDKGVGFNKEKSFKTDLVNLFDTTTSSKVLFLVDDLCFKNSVDFKQFTAIDPKEYVASLRMGKHLTFAYTLQKNQKSPMFAPSKDYTGMLEWSFNKAEHDWAYPLSVDGHLFDSEELKILINELDFKAPNSFEEALQLMNPLFSKRKGICYSESVIINNPCNKVQTENDNISGEMTIEELNDKWLSGYRIDFEKHSGILNESAHQELALEFVKR